MIRIAVLVTSFAGIASPICASAQPLDQGPRIAGLGGIGAALSGEQSGTINPAAFGTAKRLGAAVSVSRSFGLPELDHYRLQTSLRFRRARLGIGVTSFGFEEFRLQGLHFTAATSAPTDLAVGVTVSAYRLAIAGKAPASGYAAAAGAVVPVSGSVKLGAAVHNLVRIGHVHDRAGRALFIGIAAAPSRAATLLIQIDKETDFPATVRAGLEARPLPAVALRAGVSSGYASYAAGLGVDVGVAAIDVAAEYHRILGWSRAIGMVVGR